MDVVWLLVTSLHFEKCNGSWFSTAVCYTFKDLKKTGYTFYNSHIPRWKVSLRRTRKKLAWSRSFLPIVMKLTRFRLFMRSPSPSFSSLRGNRVVQAELFCQFSLRHRALRFPFRICQNHKKVTRKRTKKVTQVILSVTFFKKYRIRHSLFKNAVPLLLGQGNRLWQWLLDSNVVGNLFMKTCVIGGSYIIIKLSSILFSRGIDNPCREI